MSVTVRLAQQGRLVIPAAIRERLGLRAGDELVVSVVDDALVLARADSAARRLRGFASTVSPGRSLVEELLAERRSEAAQA